jgi:hypothetical protein
MGHPAFMYKMIGADQKEYGPVSADQLRQWLTEGRVNGQTKVQAADATEWKMMADLPEFAVLFPKAPPAPPSPARGVPIFDQAFQRVGPPAPPPPARGVPITPLPPQPGTSQMAVWAMVLGILAVLCCQILGPVAIVLGAVSLSQFKSRPELKGRGFAITGIVLGIVSLLMIIGGILLLIFTPDFWQNFQRAMQQ